MKMITPAALLRCLVMAPTKSTSTRNRQQLARRSVQRMIEIGHPGGGE